MLELAILVKCLELYSHCAHHIVSKAVFIPDHEMLGSLYSKMNGDYDNIIERFVGLKGSEALDEQQILLQAVQKCGTLPLKGNAENKPLLVNCLQQLKAINAKIELVCKEPGITQGTIQLLGEQVNQNEILLYKLQQRCK
jgi:DNA-binding ferritin-like protein